MKRAIVFLCLLLGASVSTATVIHVPSEQPTIQSGINAAVNGDTVLVEAGTYVENVYFGGMNIRLKSVEGRENTFIEPSDVYSPVVSFDSNEDTNAIIDGFTVRGTTDAHGIHCSNASPIIRNCDISYCNSTGNYGAGILCVNSGAKIRNNLIHNNGGCQIGAGICGYGDHSLLWEISGNEIYENTSDIGPGIGCTPGARDALIAFNVIRDNHGDESGSLSGGIYSSGLVFSIYNNTIVRNTMGVTLLAGSKDVRNNIIASNDFVGFTPAYATYDYNDVWGNGSANTTGSNGISIDPLFVDMPNNDFRLTASSPCIDAGDLDPQYNDPDGSRNDMGAFPYEPDCKTLHVPAEYPTIQDAIDAAGHCDTVLVADGLYYERISFLGKEILVASEFIVDGDSNHISNTIIDGDTSITPLTSDTGSVARFVVDEDSNSILSGFTIQGGVGTNGLGGGVLCDPGTPAIYNCIIKQNAASSKGGGIYSDRGGVLKGCLIQNNSAASGGGIFVPRGSIDIEFSRIEDNFGGGMLALGGSIYGSRFTNNQSYGIYHTDGYHTSEGTLILIACTLDSNTGTGVIRSADIYSSLVIDSCLFLANNEGGLRVATFDAGNGNLVSNTSFIDNSAVLGGGVYGARPNIGTFHNCLFEDNVADSGGAVYLLFQGKLFNPNSWGSFSKCTFVGNSAQCGSGICFSHNISYSIEQCTFAFNKDSSVIYHPLGASDLLLQCTDIYGNHGGDWIGELADQLGINGNISLDPLFCDTNSGDYSIMDVSPCAPANNDCGVLIGGVWSCVFGDA